jgi:hypothetical protein
MMASMGARRAVWSALAPIWQRAAATLALALLLAAAQVSGPAAAQSLSGLTLQEPAPATMAQPIGRDTDQRYTYRLWEMPGASQMSATALGDARGPIVYIEHWRTGAPPQGMPAPAPLPGLILGVTTLDEIVERFGSDGIVFEARGRVVPVGPNAAIFTSYEIENTDAVLSLVTLMPLQQATPEAIGASVLDAVSLGHGPYLDSIWGINRGRLPGYSPIADPTR